mmetsp:Transcript_67548/g.133316  ORF Transcript_67548/g.133316 Transcript_67548/m.133316 type:complete len:488 (+) Transcript_67548:49-1512(+)|eukprot:CAMPEP_0172687188 /NCGR_PEP_ID=MMETSP1074-20121228/21493_1 /TAXON_ID=2916 /ORGANISM="Ceratium fusus, Strain PA161109" /LENGTH=487 /DNA_ID=CAMNT_0013506613 /DNA_START=39 /DNA_END=1502 /DNA_ORIENTATION=-
MAPQTSSLLMREFCFLLLACVSVFAADDVNACEASMHADALLQKAKGAKLDLQNATANAAAPVKQNPAASPLGAKFSGTQQMMSITKAEENAIEMLPYICGSILAVLALTLAWEFRYLPAGFFASRSSDSTRDLAEDAKADSAGHGVAATLVDTPNSALVVWLRAALPVVFYGVFYVVCSATLIKYNKFLMTPNRFPYAANMALGHQISGSFFLFIMYKLRPSRFPSLQPENRHEMDSGLFTRGLPIAVCFGGQLLLSNMAYLHSSVAFLQMMKEGNMFLVYSLALVAGLERFQSTQARVLACLAFSTALTIEGELSFSWAGFTLQCCSQVMECLKIVWQSSLLSGKKRLDSLSYNLIVMPTAAGVLTVILFGSATGLVSNVSMAPWSAYVVWWPHLMANAVVALALNIAISLFMANTSAVGFIVAGIVKDVCLVCADVVISGTKLSHLQHGAFTLQLLFAASYSLLKTFAKKEETAAPEDTKLGKS